MLHAYTHCCRIIMDVFTVLYEALQEAVFVKRQSVLRPQLGGLEVESIIRKEDQRGKRTCSLKSFRQSMTILPPNC